jgi:antitoxin component YwqK of YwqJK toxin-antitoxin module
MNISKLNIYFIILIVIIINISCNKSNSEIDSFGNQTVTINNIFSSEIDEILYYDNMNILYRREIFDYERNSRQVKTYYKSGKVFLNFCTIENNYEGNYLVYYNNKNNSIKKKIIYINGVLIRPSFEFYENGKIFRIIKLINGFEYIETYNNNKLNTLNCRHRHNPSSSEQ